jgi:hypothetical protein
MQHQSQSAPLLVALPPPCFASLIAGALIYALRISSFREPPMKDGLPCVSPLGNVDPTARGSCRAPIGFDARQTKHSFIPCPLAQNVASSGDRELYAPIQCLARYARKPPRRAPACDDYSRPAFDEIPRKIGQGEVVGVEQGAQTTQSG